MPWHWTWRLSYRDLCTELALFRQRMKVRIGMFLFHRASSSTCCCSARRNIGDRRRCSFSFIDIMYKYYELHAELSLFSAACMNAVLTLHFEASFKLGQKHSPSSRSLALAGRFLQAENPLTDTASTRHRMRTSKCSRCCSIKRKRSSTDAKRWPELRKECLGRWYHRSLAVLKEIE